MSRSVGVITVSCTSSHDIKATAICTNCDSAPMPVSESGKSPVDITNLETGMTYTIRINVFNDGLVVLMNENVVIENVVVRSEGKKIVLHKISW